MKKLLSLILALVLSAAYIPAFGEAQADPFAVGSVITLGSYGGTPIEWQVVYANDDIAVLLSVRGIDARPYNETRKDVTWETSTLRAWLNGEFLESAFTDEERAAIRSIRWAAASANPDYDTDPGNATEDTVWLPDIDQIREWFNTDEQRVCLPTDYALAAGAWTNANSGTGMYWLRTIGSKTVTAARVQSDGSINTSGESVSSDKNLVRPAMFVSRQQIPEAEAPIIAAEILPDDFDEIDFYVAEVSAPVLSFDPVVTIADGISYVERTKIRLNWQAEGKVGYFIVDITNEDGETMWRNQTAKESLSLDAAKNLISGKTYTLTVTAVPEGGSDAEGETASAQFALYTKPPVAEIGAPEIALDRIAKTEDGVAYLLPGTTGAHWQAEGDVVRWRYRVESEDGATRFEGETDGQEWMFNASDMTEGVYTLYVTAIPQGGTDEDGLTSSMRFTLLDLRQDGTVTFGNYGGEPIVWVVLNVQEDVATLFSLKGLEAMPFNESGEAATWETSSLRAWLNGEFLETAFTDEERAMLGRANIPAHQSLKYDTDPGNNTVDTVWLMSAREAEYSHHDYARCQPTQKAVDDGVYAGISGTCLWWLRTPGYSNETAAYVGATGSISNRGKEVGIATGAVRPVIFLRLS